MIQFRLARCLSSAPKREKILTFPNALSASRILATPVLAASVLSHNYPLALGTLLYCGVSDIADGIIARRLKQESLLGSVLDPVGDKLLVGTLVGTLAYTNLFPLPLAALILARDAGLLVSGAIIRYRSLPSGFTWRAYFDPSIAGAEVRPTLVSKVNTVLQIMLLGASLSAPLLEIPLDWWPLRVLQLTVASTTAWSGLSYIKHHKEVIRYLRK